LGPSLTKKKNCFFLRGRRKRGKERIKWSVVRRKKTKKELNKKKMGSSRCTHADNGRTVK